MYQPIVDDKKKLQNIRLLVNSAVDSAFSFPTILLLETFLWHLWREEVQLPMEFPFKLEW